MSAVFEGIVLSRDRVGEAGFDVAAYLATRQKSVGVALRDLEDGSLVIARTDPRNVYFSDEFEAMAAELSGKVGNALVVRFDSRVSYRASSYFENGMPLAEFGEEDEILVVVNDDGTLSDQQYTGSQISDDDETEYELVHNAIEFGLERLGAGDWDTLCDFIHNQS